MQHYCLHISMVFNQNENIYISSFSLFVMYKSLFVNLHKNNPVSFNFLIQGQHYREAAGLNE